MTTLTVSELENGQEHLWDTFVQQSPNGGLFHLVKWKQVIENTYNHQTRYLLAKADEQIRGILPLFIIQHPIFGTHVSSPPGSICAADSEAGQHLVESARSIAQEVDAADLLLAAGARVWDGDFVTIQRHCTQRLLLPSEVDTLWKSISRHKRKNIKAARRENLAVTIGGEEHLDFFYQVFSHNLRDLGTPVFPKALLHHIFTQFPEQTKILVVVQNSQPIGALLLFTFKSVVYAHWAASFRQFRPYRPNDLLYWEMLNWACTQGYECCDMGRSQWHSGNYKFKALWGAQTSPLYYQYYLRQGVTIPDLDLKVERTFKYKMAIQTWRHLPLSLTRWAGPYLRKYLYPL